MNIGTLWFDRLRNRLYLESGEQINRVIPGLFEDDSAERQVILEELNASHPMIIGADVSKRIAPNGEPSEDLKLEFTIPFDPAFIEFDPAVKLPGLHDGKIRGIWISHAGKNDESVIYQCRVWTEKSGKSSYMPSMSFYFTPSAEWAVNLTDQEQKVVDFLIWLSGYVNSPNVLAVRHNRRHDLVRSYEQRGLLSPSSYYTFEPEKMPQTAKRLVSGKTAAIEVRGYFRRAHWHRLAGGGSAWFHTSWVRPHKRHVKVSADVELAKAA